MGDLRRPARLRDPRLVTLRMPHPSPLYRHQYDRLVEIDKERSSSDERRAKDSDAVTSPKTRVRRATVHIPASDVMPVTVRGYGFRGECACGWKSRTLGTYADARKEMRAHKFWHAESDRVSLAGPV